MSVCVCVSKRAAAAVCTNVFVYAWNCTRYVWMCKNCVQGKVCCLLE